MPPHASPSNRSKKIRMQLVSGWTGSYAALAKEIGVSKNLVSKVAKSIGHQPNQRRLGRS